MISRSGTRSSGAASGFAKILREEGSGPVVTAGSVVSGLERMFMGSSLLSVVVVVSRHCEPTGRREAPPDDRLREAIHSSAGGGMDCFVACAPRNDGGWFLAHLTRPPRS